MPLYFHSILSLIYSSSYHSCDARSGKAAGRRWRARWHRRRRYAGAGAVHGSRAGSASTRAAVAFVAAQPGWRSYLSRDFEIEFERHRPRRDSIPEEFRPGMSELLLLVSSMLDAERARPKVHSALRGGLRYEYSCSSHPKGGYPLGPRVR